MSSLIFQLDTDQVFVATDTLAVKLDGTPAQFCSKALYLPHLRTIIAGTGIATYSGDWAMYVNNWMVLSGIENLDYHTPRILRTRWEEHKREFDFSEAMTTTVYHFGFSEESDQMLGYAYRATSDFESEPIPYGCGRKPECTLPEDGNLVEKLQEMMDEQRFIQSRRPENKRLYIGGHAIGMHLNCDGCNIFRVFEFDDYQEHLDEIVLNHRADET